jgi:hypothetical protein
MEVLLALGVVLIGGGLALMALCVLYVIVVYAVALLAIGIQALWRATR